MGKVVLLALLALCVGYDIRHTRRQVRKYGWGIELNPLIRGPKSLVLAAAGGTAAISLLLWTWPVLLTLYTGYRLGWMHVQTLAHFHGT